MPLKKAPSHYAQFSPCLLLAEHPLLAKYTILRGCTSVRIVNTPTTHWWMVGVVVILAKNTRCRQWPRQNLNHDEYGGYHFCLPSLNPMTTWVRPGPKLPPICLQIILASCLRAGTQKFPEVRIKSLLSRLAFLVGIIFTAGSL